MGRPQSAGQPQGNTRHLNTTYAQSARGSPSPDGAVISSNADAIANTQTVKWQDSAHQLLANTYDLCLTASRVCAKNEEVLRDREKEVESSRKMVVETMRKRLLETADLRKALEQEIRDTDIAVAGMREGLEETERQCEMHSVPLAQLKATMQIRRKRMDGEKIRDTVTLAKEDVLQVINSNVRTLQEQYKRKKTVLDQMTSIRQQLQEDLKCKVQAMTIDNQCSKLLTRPHSARLGGSAPTPPGQIVKPHFRRKAQREYEPMTGGQQYQQQQIHFSGGQQYQQQGGFVRTWGPGGQAW